MNGDPTRAAEAIARPNVALVKYWGKRQASNNLPATGSISVTLRDLTTRTRVRFSAALLADELILNGERADGETISKAARVLDALRRRAGVALHALVESQNDFPTGAGLASSASGFAALAAAAAAALDQRLAPAELSALARLGSGSAARSIFGGFVEMRAGVRDDGADAVASPLLAAEAWPVTILVAVVSVAKKGVASTVGMEQTRATSPYWRAWLESADADLAEMRAAVLRRDLATAGELAEHSCLKMHALALAARPGLVYFAPATIAVIHEIRALRQRGLAAYFTIDAGPQVKILCEARDAESVRAAILAISGVERVVVTAPGPGVETRAIAS